MTKTRAHGPRFCLCVHTRCAFIQAISYTDAPRRCFDSVIVSNRSYVAVAV
jgi:hypothetical protein